MANPLGQRCLDRYTEGDLTLDQLDAALAKGWISQDEYDAAVA